MALQLVQDQSRVIRSQAPFSHAARCGALYPCRTTGPPHGCSVAATAPALIPTQVPTLRKDLSITSGTDSPWLRLDDTRIPEPVPVAVLKVEVIRD